MNTGVFMEFNKKICVYPFYNFVGKLPLEKLENAICSLESDGYFTITNIKNRRVNPQNFYVVQKGKMLEDPFELSTLRMASLFGKSDSNYEVIDGIKIEAINDSAFIEELIRAGFYRTDKMNFKRAISKDKFDRRKKAVRVRG